VYESTCGLLIVQIVKMINHKYCKIKAVSLYESLCAFKPLDCENDLLQVVQE